MQAREFSSCGVGFVSSLKDQAEHRVLKMGLHALGNLEHRGGTGVDMATGDGAGVMCDIPHALYGSEPGSALANLYLPRDPTDRVRALGIFESTFQSLGLEIYKYREVPVDTSVLVPATLARMPGFLMAFVRRPANCTTRYSFEKLLYMAKQLTRSRLREAAILNQFFFASLSAGTVVYKGLVTSDVLPRLFLDLQHPQFETRFCLFHRRFSTNTQSTWDKAQPFRVVAHNGEINTISGNRAWAYARERGLGLKPDELLTHKGISDSGSVNEMMEALLFRSSIPNPQDILAIMMPKAGSPHSFYQFWSRAMEPWDGPALFTYAEGRTIGARLDRSGFRPCRFMRSSDYFFLCSEAGAFEVPEVEIIEKGALSGGASITIDLKTGRISRRDASETRENAQAVFAPGTTPIASLPSAQGFTPSSQAPESGAFQNVSRSRFSLFAYTDEDIKKHILPMVQDGKEAIGSMGDTARPAFLSTETRSFFDFFYQNFAQVTNPPLDFIRERMVCDMSVVLGRKPNIFEPKELIPPKAGLELDGPVLSLSDLQKIKALSGLPPTELLQSEIIELQFEPLESDPALALLNRIDQIIKQAARAVKQRKSILVLSDRPTASELDHAQTLPFVPPVLAVSAIVQHLNTIGMGLRASIVVETGEVKTPHHLAVLCGFGAAAVCPYIPLEIAHKPQDFELQDSGFTSGTPETRERRVIQALQDGLLKIMSKMGVSVLQSYQGAELFTILGFGTDVHERFFPRHSSLVGGLCVADIASEQIQKSRGQLRSQIGAVGSAQAGLVQNYLYRESPKDSVGEHHAMTVAKSRMVHRLIEGGFHEDRYGEFESLAEVLAKSDPVHIRQLFTYQEEARALDIKSVESREDILTRFGSGAMSFGAISAESQRDLIVAMRQIGGRSNSGEGGENPFYFSSDRTVASTKQVASGRFGVTAEYLINGHEIQIKMAQGAKPGEGGQLMAIKVDTDIARARFADTHVDLISPPPMHDIYSIEDLKQLIYELRQIHPTAEVSVKLVSGQNIGTIAVGVAKAGADVIHVAGHDGGTGAATLSSMKHCGLPWELGLREVHQALSREGLRQHITLRVDGGLTTGKDVIVAALMGAEQFDFGKILLIAEGCIMARVCEKNTCPTGIATHDPKFKAKYKGNAEKVVTWLRFVAEDVRHHLAKLGVKYIDDIVGRTELLRRDARFVDLIGDRQLDLSAWLSAKQEDSRLAEHNSSHAPKLQSPFRAEVSELNREIVEDVLGLRSAAGFQTLRYEIRSTDRAVMATLSGQMAAQRSGFLAVDRGQRPIAKQVENILFEFVGSAGQGFGAFLEQGLRVQLKGEANDAVAKSICGGELVVVPASECKLEHPARHAIVGNCALYGATSGQVFVYGKAGDRFAVRNSGAIAVVEGVGLHACEYMTRGQVLILGEAGPNIGAGMTGGRVYLRRDDTKHLHSGFLEVQDLSGEDLAVVMRLISEHHHRTRSETAEYYLKNPKKIASDFILGALKSRQIEGKVPFKNAN